MRSTCSLYSGRRNTWHSARNRIFKRVEPNFRTSATRSASKEDTKNAVALTHPQEYTKELIFAQTIFGSMGTFGARAAKRNVLRKNNDGRRGSSVFVGVSFVVFCGQCNIVRVLHYLNFAWHGHG